MVSFFAQLHGRNVERVLTHLSFSNDVKLNCNRGFASMQDLCPLPNDSPFPKARTDNFLQIFVPQYTLKFTTLAMFSSMLLIVTINTVKKIKSRDRICSNLTASKQMLLEVCVLMLHLPRFQLSRLFL